jgi:hypothetical protein
MLDGAVASCNDFGGFQRKIAFFTLRGDSDRTSKHKSNAEKKLQMLCRYSGEAALLTGSLAAPTRQLSAALHPPGAWQIR